ncbi:hypothetical protein FNV43_RR11590 [Rhamnella rubrinervis]|uniref:Uncharacterized protein n=1 Tax=Rhamnella rubrinervis TaxID=2594499 RepID=A0A8K0H620_9ROSA|nr:hypothetical protein FNV43_RR11590 [Rhamnella rubrinervis]
MRSAHQRLEVGYDHVRDRLDQDVVDVDLHTAKASVVPQESDHWVRISGPTVPILVIRRWSGSSDLLKILQRSIFSTWATPAQNPISLFHPFDIESRVTVISESNSSTFSSREFNLPVVSRWLDIGQLDSHLFYSAEEDDVRRAPIRLSATDLECSMYATNRNLGYGQPIFANGPRSDHSAVLYGPCSHSVVLVKPFPTRGHLFVPGYSQNLLSRARRLNHFGILLLQWRIRPSLITQTPSFLLQNYKSPGLFRSSRGVVMPLRSGMAGPLLSWDILIRGVQILFRFLPYGSRCPREWSPSPTSFSPKLGRYPSGPPCRTCKSPAAVQINPLRLELFRAALKASNSLPIDPLPAPLWSARVD